MFPFNRLLPINIIATNIDIYRKFLLKHDLINYVFNTHIAIYDKRQTNPRRKKEIL